MTSIKPPGADLPDNLPLLTQVANEHLPDDLPTLTEVVARGQAEPAAVSRPAADREAPAHEAAVAASCPPDNEKMRQLLQRLETHLENVFVCKLSLALEQLQRQAVEQAVSELKAELPELLREALSTPDSRR